MYYLIEGKKSVLLAWEQIDTSISSVCLCICLPGLLLCILKCRVRRCLYECVRKDVCMCVRLCVCTFCKCNYLLNKHVIAMLLFYSLVHVHDFKPINEKVQSEDIHVQSDKNMFRFVLSTTLRRKIGSMRI